MIGMVHNMLFGWIEGKSGNKAVNEIKRKAGIPLHTDFRMDTSYSDVTWQKIVVATVETLNIQPGELEKDFMDFFLKASVKRFPAWWEMAKNSYDFILQQPKIHNGFATSLMDSEERKKVTEKFKIEALKNKLITYYRSDNGLCNLYIQGVHWVVNYYNDAATVQEEKCTKKGNPYCEIHIEWDKLGET